MGRLRGELTVEGQLFKCLYSETVEFEWSSNILSDNWNQLLNWWNQVLSGHWFQDIFFFSPPLLTHRKATWVVPNQSHSWWSVKVIRTGIFAQETVSKKVVVWLTGIDTNVDYKWHKPHIHTQVQRIRPSNQASQKLCCIFLV